MSDLFSTTPVHPEPSNALESFSPWDLPPTSVQANGAVKVWLFDQKSLPRSASSRMNVSEWPNEASVKALAEVLERDVDKRFYISPKGCAGILYMAKNRGKQLPTKLKEALEASAGHAS